MKTNHQRGFVEQVSAWVGEGSNGYPLPQGETSTSIPYGKRRSLYIGFGEVGEVSGKVVVASASCGDHCKAKHGIARDIRGAKKFVRSRIRFHENAATRRLHNESESEE